MRERHHVYVIELDKDVLLEVKFKNTNPNYVTGKPCVLFCAGALVGLRALNLQLQSAFQHCSKLIPHAICFCFHGIQTEGTHASQDIHMGEDA
jgi:hypothetical protein